MTLSGFAGLGYEMVWTRMLSVALGHEIVAVLGIIGAFFLGLGIGAWLLDDAIRRSRVPGAWYAGLEVAIAVWALSLLFLIPAFNRWVPTALGTDPGAAVQWLAVFLGTLLLLFPATAAMGATLPAMDRFLAAWSGNQRNVGGLYAANTLGAVLGTAASTFLLAPVLGYTATVMVLVGANLVAAVIMFVLGRRCPAVGPFEEAVSSEGAGRRRLLMLLAVTGFLGIGYEVAVIRVLSEVLENTVYTFASLLCVYLGGTAVGAALYQRFVRNNDFDRVLSRCLLALGTSCLLGTVVLYAVEPLHFSLTDLLGNGYLPAIGGEMIIALLVFLAPTAMMGMTFSHLAQAARNRLGLGRALAANTIPGALAPLVVGVLLLPMLGNKLALLLISIAYLALLPLPRDRRGILAPAGVLGVAVLIALFPWPIRVIGVPPGGQLIEYRQGIMASVSVVEDAGRVRYLKVNNHYAMGSTASRLSDRRQTHIPLLLHPEPRRALFLGLGTGSTFSAVDVWPDLDATAVELVPEVLPMLGYFGPPAEAYNSIDRFRLVVSDARRFVRADDASYDVVVAEVFHPSRDGAGSLYTREHFSAVRRRLADDGLFCQWLPLFQLDLATLKTIVRTFSNVYPDAEAYLAHFSLGQPILGLVGRKAPQRYERGWWSERVQSRRLAEDLNSVRLNSDFALFGGFVGAGRALSDFAGPGPVNTDDKPVVNFSAPGFVYADPEPAWIRLLEVLDGVPSRVPDFPLADDAGDFGERLKEYWRARNDYVASGVDVVPTDDAGALLEQIEEPLLRAVRTSNDFVPAYIPLLELAYEIHASDPARALSLLEALESAGPERAEARQLRYQLFPDS